MKNFNYKQKDITNIIQKKKTIVQDCALLQNNKTYFMFNKNY